MTEPKFTEEWRPVIGMEGIYSVSNAGDVRIEVTRQNIRAGECLIPGIVKNGYFQVPLSRTGTRETTTRHMVHRLVYSAFVGPIPPGHVINHLDGDKQNNRLDNLEACTHKENVAHSMHVLGNRRDGEHNPAAKLSEADVVAIRERAARGESRTSIAADYGITCTMACNIATGKSWKSSSGPRSRTPRSRRLTHQQRAEAIRRVLAGEADIPTVARELGVDKAAIYYHLKKAGRTP